MSTNCTVSLVRCHHQTTATLLQHCRLAVARLPWGEPLDPCGSLALSDADLFAASNVAFEVDDQPDGSVRAFDGAGREAGLMIQGVRFRVREWAAAFKDADGLCMPPKDHINNRHPKATSNKQPGESRSRTKTWYKDQMYLNRNIRACIASPSCPLNNLTLCKYASPAYVESKEHQHAWRQSGIKISPETGIHMAFSNFGVSQNWTAMRKVVTKVDLISEADALFLDALFDDGKRNGSNLPG
mmetsp:Transcript_48189/g.134742  ORF Transcript_48189/g.134742 Transcript_48189/m.134742 type:complete len:242 (-) Transcript_48189:1153-1878(-)